MRFCTNCGDKLEENTRFCTNCGAKINDEPASFDSVKTVFAESIQPTANEVPPAPQQYKNQSYPSGQIQQTANIGQALEKAAEKKKSSNKILIPIIIVAVIAILGAGAAIFCKYYFSPENKYERALSNGYKALLEKNWEDAIEAFDQAIEIDNNSISAQYGKLQACIEMDDQEQKEAVYAEVLDVIDDLDEETIKNNQEDIVDIYLESTNSIYADDDEKAIPILEEGYEVTADDGIKKSLINIYLNDVNSAVKEEKFEDAFGIIDKLIELDKNDKKVQKAALELINSRIGELYAAGDFEAVKKLNDKYGESVSGTELETVIADIDKFEAEDKKINDFMQKVYDKMLTEDFDAMRELDGSDEANEIANMIEGNNYYYIPSGETKGTGVGLCKFGESAYYFYFGNIENEVKTGKGNAFILVSNSGSYNYLTGEWENDAPNGECVIKIIGYTMNTSGSEYNETVKGNMKNGLWDGYISDKVYSNGTTFYLDFEAKDGYPTKFLTDEFNEKYGYSEEYVYAYDLGKDGYITWSTLGYEGDTLGWSGFES